MCTLFCCLWFRFLAYIVFLPNSSKLLDIAYSKFFFVWLQVAFHALRFAPPILELGNKLADRMRNKGSYLALHLRMEKDVWVRTGCLPGLSPENDEMINNERKRRPELLTDTLNMTYHERKLAGLCPLNVMQVTRWKSKFEYAHVLYINLSSVVFLCRIYQFYRLNFGCVFI